MCRVFGLGLALAVAAALSTPSAVAAQGSDSRTSVKRPNISGTFIDALQGQGEVNGHLELGHFAVEQNFLVVVATLTGVVAESTGQIIGRVNEEIVLPVAVVDSTCQLLHLDVGPLDLEVEGLHVQFDTSSLGITTQDGPTRTALCSMATFLASRPPVRDIAVRLNALLGTLTTSK
jgi:hypothetical protein